MRLEEAMPTVIVKVSGGWVQEVLMDEPVEVYVLDYDNPPPFPEQGCLYIDGEECTNAYFADVLDPEKVRHIVRQLRSGPAAEKDSDACPFCDAEECGLYRYGCGTYAESVPLWPPGQVVWKQSRCCRRRQAEKGKA